MDAPCMCKALYQLVALMFPCALISLVCSLVFLIPAESQEKVRIFGHIDTYDKCSYVMWTAFVAGDAFNDNSTYNRRLHATYVH